MYWADCEEIAAALKDVITHRSSSDWPESRTLRASRRARRDGAEIREKMAPNRWGNIASLKAGGRKGTNEIATCEAYRRSICFRAAPQRQLGASASPGAMAAQHWTLPLAPLVESKRLPTSTRRPGNRAFYAGPRMLPLDAAGACSSSQTTGARARSPKPLASRRVTRNRGSTPPRRAWWNSRDERAADSGPSSLAPPRESRSTRWSLAIPARSALFQYAASAAAARVSNPRRAASLHCRRAAIARRCSNSSGDQPPRNRVVS
jgi:hypothetical protein